MAKHYSASIRTGAMVTGTSQGFSGGSSGNQLSSGIGTGHRLIYKLAGLINFLQIFVDNVGTARSVTVRKNGTNTALAVSPPDTTQGLFTDVTNQVAVAAGDYIDAERIFTGTPQLIQTGTIWEASGGQAYTVYASLSTTAVGTSSNVYPIAGLTSAGTFPGSNAQTKHRVAGSFTHMWVYIGLNGRDGANTFTLQVNGSNVGNTISVGAGLTGLFEDTSHTDTIAAGDLVAINQSIGGTTGNWIAWTVGVGFKPSGSQPTFDQLGGPSGSFTGGTTSYHPFCSRPVAGSVTTEAFVQAAHGYAVKVTNLRVNISANTLAATGTFNSRINGVDGNQTISIGAGLTGWFEDTTHTDYVGASDLMNSKFSGGTSGSCTVQGIGQTETEFNGHFFEMF